MKARAIEPAEFPWFDYHRYSFSLGLTHGDTVLLSGHSASEYDPDEGRIVVRGGMRDQARTAYAKIDAILAAAGSSLGSATRIVENVTAKGIDFYADAEAVRAQVLGDRRPAVNTVVVNHLLRPDALIEVEVTAGPEGEALVLDDARPARASAYRAGDVVYISTIHPVDDSGAVVGAGDVVAQVEQIFLNLERVLGALGLGMQNVVKTLEMIAPDGLADYKATGPIRRQHLGPVYPAAAGILQDRVAADDDILISYDVIASTSPPEAVNPGWDRYGKLTYSPAVRAGGTLFMSGQAALDPHTERAVHPGDIVAQTEYTYRNVIAVLEAAGLGPEDLVKTVEYVTPEGLERYRETAAVRRALLGEPYPASTGIICRSLLRREFTIEIDPMAIFPGE